MFPCVSVPLIFNIFRLIRLSEREFRSKIVNRREHRDADRKWIRESGSLAGREHRPIREAQMHFSFLSCALVRIDRTHSLSRL
jgi:hypothetical protein